MKLEKHISKWYRFSSLKEVGKIGFLAIAIVTSLGIWAALYLPSSDDEIEGYRQQSKESYLTIHPIHVKNNDAYFHLFLERLRENGDVLALGTSESGFQDGYNYWELLNADSELEEQFSILYGAGRSCERYIPSMLNNPEAWQKQKLLVIINPVYWRESLSSFNLEYHTRYINNQELRSARRNSNRKEDFDLLFSAGSNSFMKAQMEEVNSTIDKNVHVLFYDRIRNFIDGKTTKINHFDAHPEYADVSNFLEPKKLSGLQANILPEYNCNQEYINKGDYCMTPLLLDADYRNTALDYFMDLCHQLKIDVTFVLGPYNKILAEKCEQPEIIRQHEQLEDHLRETFEKEGFHYIDASDASSIPSSFADKQHHSGYGGYLIYQQIKENWHE